MPAILSQRDLQQCRKLPFCYLCGEAFSPGEAANRDHVPPSAIFASADKNRPLILPTHPHCNEANSVNDEKIGQLVSLLHGRYPPIDKLRLDVSRHEIAGSDVPSGGLSNLPLRAIIFRWLRAFHAALYREYLPSCGGYIHMPLPEGNVPGQASPVHSNHLLFTATIKKNRVSKTTDRIVCWNGRCQYECVWAKLDDGSRNLCIFALDIYDWKSLGDIHHYPARSCVGMYMPAHIPPAASYDTKLIFPFANRQPTDAFGD